MRNTVSTITLLCFPFAGAGASFFRPWRDLARDRFTLLPIQLPGREKRFVEEPYRDVTQAINGVLPDLSKQIDEQAQVVIFGHSMGAILAYELARRLTETKAVKVELLVVSGSPGPWHAREQRATGLDDESFLARVREFAGYNHAALSNPDMRAMLLPVFRADVELHENYRPSSDQPLAVPILAVRGASDEIVSAAQASQWQQVTTKRFEQIELPGGHMYLTEVPDQLLDAIERTLATDEQ